MTIEALQKEMVAALKSGDKFRKSVISTVIARIKNTAIDKGCRDSIPEEMVSAELLKAKKITQEMIDTCPASRTDLLEDYKKQMAIIMEFVPSLIEDENEIRSMISNSGVFTGEKSCQGAVMKYMKQEFAGKVDMKRVSQIFKEMVS